MKEEQAQKQFSNPVGGAALQIQVKVGAEKNSIRKISASGLILIDLEKEKAGNTPKNKLLVDYLSKVLKISPGQIEIVAEDDENKKLVCLSDIPVELVNKRLSQNT